MYAVILAAGSGTRLEPITSTMSKPMVPVANRPIIDWVIETARHAADKIIVVVRPDQADMIQHLKGCKGVELAYQEKPLGTGHAMLQAKDKITSASSASDCDFLLLNGDNFTTPSDIKALSRLPSPAMAGIRVPNPQDFGVLTIEGGKVTEVIEKPVKPKSDVINAGMYKLNASIFSLMEGIGKSERGEYEITDAFAKIMPMSFHELTGWANVTYPWDILEANKFVLDNWGKQIGKAEIRPGAYIEQPVAIGDGAVIGPNCYIRAYSSIGPGCKVGNAVEIKNSIIMANSFVSHLSYVGDSIIGKNCNIAAGTIFANLRLDEKNVKMQIKGKLIDTGRRKFGGLVGDNVRLGVNCTIMPGRRIWPNIMVPPCTMIKTDVTKQPDLKNWKPTLA